MTKSPYIHGVPSDRRLEFLGFAPQRKPGVTPTRFCLDWNEAIPPVSLNNLAPSPPQEGFIGKLMKAQAIVPLMTRHTTVYESFREKFADLGFDPEEWDVVYFATMATVAFEMIFVPHRDDPARALERISLFCTALATQSRLVGGNGLQFKAVSRVVASVIRRGEQAKDILGLLRAVKLWTPDLIEFICEEAMKDSARGVFNATALWSCEVLMHSVACISINLDELMPGISSNHLARCEEPVRRLITCGMIEFQTAQSLSRQEKYQAGSVAVFVVATLEAWRKARDMDPLDIFRPTSLAGFAHMRTGAPNLFLQGFEMFVDEGCLISPIANRTIEMMDARRRHRSTGYHTDLAGLYFHFASLKSVMFPDCMSIYSIPGQAYHPLSEPNLRTLSSLFNTMMLNCPEPSVHWIFRIDDFIDNCVHPLSSVSITARLRESILTPAFIEKLVQIEFAPTSAIAQAAKTSKEAPANLSTFHIEFLHKLASDPVTLFRARQMLAPHYRRILSDPYERRRELSSTRLPRLVLFMGGTDPSLGKEDMCRDIRDTVETVFSRVFSCGRDIARRIQKDEDGAVGSQCHDGFLCFFMADLRTFLRRGTEQLAVFIKDVTRAALNSPALKELGSIMDHLAERLGETDFDVFLRHYTGLFANAKPNCVPSTFFVQIALECAVYLQRYLLLHVRAQRIYAARVIKGEVALLDKIEGKRNRTAAEMRAAREQKIEMGQRMMEERLLLKHTGNAVKTHMATLRRFKAALDKFMTRYKYIYGIYG